MKSANQVSAPIFLWSQAFAGPRRGLAAAACLLAVGLLGTGCGDKPAASPPPPSVAAALAKPISAWFPIKVGPETVRMQLAITDAEMEHGLMDRRDLEPDEGMIFIWPKVQKMRFWMHNTPTDLDIGYFTADGMLHEVYQMYKFDESSVSSQSDAIQFCLEMNLHWYSDHKVMPGTAALDLKALAAALKERGADPAKYGL
jgi:uncharacterized membrane protein (UPF0127 family)